MLTYLPFVYLNFAVTQSYLHHIKKKPPIYWIANFSFKAQNGKFFRNTSNSDFTWINKYGVKWYKVMF